MASGFRVLAHSPQPLGMAKFYLARLMSNILIPSRRTHSHIAFVKH